MTRALDPLAEPLAESAPLARRLALQLCHRDPHSGESCAWNHGLWQTLRLMGFVLTPAHHAPFFREALAMATPRAGALRVLVSGCADYGMLAQALSGLRPCGAPLHVTVLDLCETPLALNRWYAARLGVEIETVRSDILDYRPAAAFDVLCTHSFLPMFPAEQRPEVLAQWSRLLRPGGLAITVDRIRGAAAAASVGFSAEQAQSFSTAVLETAKTLSLPLEASQLAREADEYAARRRVHPVRTVEEVRELFANAGFGPLRLHSAPVTIRAPSQASGPTIPTGGEYLHIIAQR